MRVNGNIARWFGLSRITGLRLLHSQHGLVSKHIRKRALHSPRLSRAVKIHHQVMRSRTFGNSIIKIDAGLVVPLDEIDLQSGNAPLLIKRERLLHLPHPRRRRCIQIQTFTFFDAAYCTSAGMSTLPFICVMS